MALGRFITIEGGEGAGKSTNADIVVEYIRDRGLDAVATREPGGTSVAEEVRLILLAERDEAVDPLTETLLMFAARAQHLATLIEPNLRAGRWVVCERFTDSTFAYQGGGRGVDSAVIERLAEFVHGHCWPDLTLYLDVPVRDARPRLAGRRLDRFEQERGEFFERVRGVYLARADAYDRIVSIDASRDLDAVQRDIGTVLSRFMATS